MMTETLNGTVSNCPPRLLRYSKKAVMCSYDSIVCLKSQVFCHNWLDFFVELDVGIEMLVVVEPGAAHTNIESDSKEGAFVIFAAAEEETIDILWGDFGENIGVREDGEVEIIKRVADGWHWIDDIDDRITLLVWHKKEVVRAKIAMNQLLWGWIVF